MSEGSNRKHVLFGLAWLFCFMQSLNSYEYILFLQIFVWGYYLLYRRQLEPKKLLIFAAAPLLGVAIHLAQVILFLGVDQFWADYANVFLFRTVGGVQGDLWAYLDSYRGQLGEGIRDSYGASTENFLIAFLGVMFAVWVVAGGVANEGLTGGSSGREAELRVVLVLGLASVAWYAVFMQSTINFIVYMPKHLFPVLGLSVGMMTTDCVRVWRDLGRSQPLSVRIIPALIVVLLIWTPFLSNTASYFRDYPNVLGPRVYPAGNPTSKWLHDVEICRGAREMRTPGTEGFIFTRYVFSSHTSPGKFPQVNALLQFYCGGNVVAFNEADDFYSALRTIVERIRRPSDFLMVVRIDDPMAAVLEASKRVESGGIVMIQLAPRNVLRESHVWVKGEEFLRESGLRAVDLTRGAVEVSSVNKRSEEGGMAIDGDPGSYWHVAVPPASPIHWITIDLGRDEAIRMVGVKPRKAHRSQFWRGKGAVLAASTDGRVWTFTAGLEVDHDELGADTWVYFDLRSGLPFRYYRLVISDEKFLSLAEVKLYKRVEENP
jgi:hypothetical protein